MCQEAKIKTYKNPQIDLLPRTVPPGEERGGGFEELRVGCRTAGWELGDFLTLVFPLAGCFPFWLVISLL